MQTPAASRARTVFALLCLLAAAPLIAQSQAITPQEQQGIDRDIAQHEGDAPANPGRLAHLSGKMRPAAIRTAMRNVADWELERAQPYFDDTWTWATLYDGFMAATPALHDPKYQNAMEAMAESFHWQLRS
ncbi:MAG: glycoside hydrolase family 88 protein, partial [Acidobacteriaceae bacterium]